MGKSGKKTKSDRINALRKQYDAFLDEDKKRKDRNEFILGRLEKMRSYTPAVLPIHRNLVGSQINKYPYINQDRPEYIRKIRFDDEAIMRQRPIDVLSDCLLKDEQRILQEISKKYILIPKLRPTSEIPVTYYNPSSITNDSDWRNKYNILDELKRKEKEGSPEVTRDTDVAHNTTENEENRDLGTSAADDTREQKVNSEPIHYTQENKDKEPVTDLKINNTKALPTNDPTCIVYSKPSLENKRDVIPSNIEDAKYTNLGEIEIANEKSHLYDSNKANNEFYNPSENVANDEPTLENKIAEKVNYTPAQNIPQKEIKLKGNIVPKKADEVVENKKIIENETSIQNNTVDQNHSEICNNNITVLLTEKGQLGQSLKTNEVVAHPVEHIDKMEPSVNIGQVEPISDDIQQQESNNETAIVSDDIVPSQIEEFEAEQRGMFYADETAYNQNVDSTAYNPQNEEYTNDQYNYYNEPQQEQPYYAEINEHEESTERYDPNYEQQYVENYEQNVNYVNQPYEGEGYVNQQEVTNVNYVDNNQQEINVNYEQQPVQQDLTNAEYEQQPFTYEYDQSVNPDQSQVENINTYDGQAEHANYETQQYAEVGEAVHAVIPDQNVYETQQGYAQMHTEQETIQNLEQQLDGEEGYQVIHDAYQNEPAAAVVNSNEIDPNIKVA